MNFQHIKKRRIEQKSTGKWYICIQVERNVTNTMIANIRMHSQQLVSPGFEHPKDLVAWMGAIQAQDYPMSKWVPGWHREAYKR